MSWKYSVISGKFYDSDGQYVSTGYAGGHCGEQPEGKNNPDMCDQRMVGPLPYGPRIGSISDEAPQGLPNTYTFGEAVERSHLGAFAIPLIPHKDNDMKGRGSFFMHGDTTPSGNASDGCIIQPPATRHTAYESDDKEVEVWKDFENKIIS